MADDPCRAWKSFAACAMPLIPVLIKQMTAVTEQTEAAALNLMTKLQTIAQRASRQADDAIAIMGRASERRTDDGHDEELRVSAQNAKQQADELSNDIGQIVMALQFQDITRQKLEHVEVALTRLRNHFQHLIDNKPDEDLKDSLSLLKELEGSYTMEAERRIHAAATGRAPDMPPQSASPGDEEDSVTLFSS
jgi:methyl-accepting chemotaxis protein